ncbi:tyrosine-type recombinase/integrase [Thauera aromatica]|uniref:Integrase n=1 Tax=Thauera aromatica K172 TaxID=44139 RepID=A0A2R4BPA9_THAAR|nr:integrase family protein [Thauera aromatica]AVR89062.1 Integrase [Thauera aromatica K172]
MTFDARTIKLLPAGEHLTSPEFPGLRIVATESGRAWTYRYKSPIDGRMRQTKLGEWPAMSVHLAVAAWDGLRRAREAGEDPALAAKEARAEKRRQVEAKRRQAMTAAYTVLDVCNDYYAGHIRITRQRKGAAEVRRMFDLDLGATASLPAATLTRSQAFDLIRSIAERAPVQAQNLRSELGAAWDYAIDSGRLPDTSPNWWRLILRGKIKSKGKKIGGQHVGTSKRVLTADETGEVIRWLPNFSSLVEDVLTLYLWTATRGAEICGMSGSEVREEADGILWWQCPKEKTKNARHENATDLRVPLFGRARTVVLRRKDLYGAGYLFPAKTKVVKPVEQKTVQVAVYHHQPYSRTRPDEPRPRLPVTHWAPHDLRRTARTLLASIGCPNEVGEAVIGHMQPGIVGTYNLHSYDDQRVEWLRRLDAHLEGLARR